MTPNNGNPSAKPVPRSNLAASAGELNEFLQHLRGKTPQEILGAITQSGLARAFVQATIGAVVLVVVFTIVPFLIAKQFPATMETSSNAPVTATASTPTPGPATNPNPNSNTAAATATVSSGSGAASTPAGKASATEVLDKLGENITKTSSPKVNPLDKKDDDLFKELNGK